MFVVCLYVWARIKKIIRGGWWLSVVCRDGSKDWKYGKLPFPLFPVLFSLTSSHWSDWFLSSSKKALIQTRSSSALNKTGGFQPRVQIVFAQLFCMRKVILEFPWPKVVAIINGRFRNVLFFVFFCHHSVEVPSTVNAARVEMWEFPAFLVSLLRETTPQQEEK